MDPITGVGLAASGVQLADFAFKVFTNICRYYRDVKDAPASVTKVREEMDSLLNVLCQCQETFEQHPKMLSRSTILEQLSGLRAVLNQLYARTSPKETTGLRRLKWPFDQKETNEILHKLRRYQSTLNTALNVVQWAQGKEITKYLNWLCPEDLNPQWDHVSLTETCTFKTASWIFDHPSFQHWESGPSSLMWLYGKMGCGKTILACSITNKLLADNKDDPEICVAFFYCKGKAVDTTDTRYILGSIIRQLLSRIPFNTESPRYQYLKDLYENKKRLFRVTEMLESIQCLTKSYSQVFVIIDGLDEISRPKELCSAISQLVGCDSNMKVLVLSRPEHDIDEALKSVPRMVMDQIAIQADIEVYVQARLQESSFQNIDIDLRRTITDRLLLENGGVFRWVSCQMDFLATLDRDYEREKALENLPPGLPATYHQILSRHPPHSDRLKITLTALTWLLYATKSLKLADLATVAVMEPNVEFSKKMKLTYDDILLRYCGSLVTYKPASRIVEFSHFSVIQFLKAQVVDGLVNPFFLDPVDGHRLIMQSCFTCMKALMPPVAADALGNFSQLADYISHEWPRHAKEVDRASHCDMLSKFLDGPTLKAWAYIWDEPYRRTTDFYFPDKEVDGTVSAASGGLYYASMFCLTKTVERYLLEGHDPLEPGGYFRCPLLAAACTGSEEVCCLLYFHLAGDRITSEQKEIVLFYSLLRGWWRLARELVKAGARPCGNIYDANRTTCEDLVIAGWQSINLDDDMFDRLRERGSTNPVEVMNETELEIFKLMLSLFDVSPGSNRMVYWALESSRLCLAKALLNSEGTVYHYSRQSDDPFTDTVLRVNDWNLQWGAAQARLRSISQEAHLLRGRCSASTKNEVVSLNEWTYLYEIEKGITAAQKCMDSALELYNEKAVFKSIEEIRHFLPCSDCSRHLLGMRYVCFNEDKYQINWSICTGCVRRRCLQSESVLLYLAYPSMQWIKTHVDDRVVVVPLLHPRVSETWSIEPQLRMIYRHRYRLPFLYRKFLSNKRPRGSNKRHWLKFEPSFLQWAPTERKYEPTYLEWAPTEVLGWQLRYEEDGVWWRLLVLMNGIPVALLHDSLQGR